MEPEHIKRVSYPQEITVQFETKDFEIDGSKCPDTFYGPNINQSVETLVSAGFKLLDGQSWEPIWGQGDGYWRKCTLERGDIRLETTSDSHFDIYLSKDGHWQRLNIFDDKFFDDCVDSVFRPGNNGD